MALSSQSSRSGTSGRYRASRRRRGRRWPWLLLVALLAAGSFYLFSGGGDDARENLADDDRDAQLADASSARQAEQREAANEQSAAPRQQSAPAVARAGATPRVADMTPVAEVRSSATRSQQTADSSADDASRSAAQQASRSRANEQRERDSRAARQTSNRQAANRQQSASSTAGIESEEMRKGMDLLADGEVIEGRRVLSDLLFDDRRRLSASDARAIRETLASVNDRLVFSPEVAANDPVAEHYEVQSGDLLARIARRYKLTYQFLEQINRIDARRLQVGQSVKLIRGPFHARVSKREYRMDVFVRQNDGSPIYVRSFDVGLGEDDSTPEGLWVIEPNRKVVNPDWRNPRTGEYFRSDDPENPIGNFWLALEGIDENTADRRGYGIHGTIEPDSVGQSVSMGCIRLRDDDIEQIFYMLVEGESTVEVVR